MCLSQIEIIFVDFYKLFVILYYLYENDIIMLGKEFLKQFDYLYFLLIKKRF